MSHKYITFAARKDGIDFCSFFRFNEHLVHADVAQLMIPVVAMSYSCCMTDVHILGAGFVDHGLLGEECFGKSESLNIVSRGEEDAIIMRWPGSTYITDSPEENENESTGRGVNTDDETAHEKSAAESR